MGGRKSNSYSDYEMTRAAVVALRELKTSGWDVRVSVGIGETPASLTFDLKAYASPRAPENQYVARYRGEWPNASPASFAAFFFQAVTKLHTLVPDDSLWDEPPSEAARIPTR